MTSAHWLWPRGRKCRLFILRAPWRTPGKHEQLESHGAALPRVHNCRGTQPPSMWPASRSLHMWKPVTLTAKQPTLTQHEPPQGCQVKLIEVRSFSSCTLQVLTRSARLQSMLWSKLAMLQNLGILYQKTKRRTKCKPGTTWRVGGTPRQQGISACPEHPGDR